MHAGALHATAKLPGTRTRRAHAAGEGGKARVGRGPKRLRPPAARLVPLALLLYSVRDVSASAGGRYEDTLCSCKFDGWIKTARAPARIKGMCCLANLFAFALLSASRNITYAEEQ